MLIFFILVLVALAALGGYVFGTLRRSSVGRASEAGPPSQAPRAGQAPEAASGAQPQAVQRTPPAEQASDDRVGLEKARLIRSRDAEAAILRQQVADRDAVLAQLQDLARERERLFGELADARAEAARYRQLIVDIENNAPPPILSGPAGPDDLKLIVGVGPVLERMLHNLGVTTFRQIARWTDRDVAEFDAKLPEFPGRIVRDQWVTQARALHESKYGQRL